MDLTTMLKKTLGIAAENSPVILTTIGVTGTLATAFLTGKATFQAAEVIRVEELARVDTMTKETVPTTFQDKAALTWKLYIPAAIAAGFTIACIIAANRIDSRRTAALAAAWASTEKAYDEYQKKTKEALGAKKEEAMRVKLAEERMNQLPPGMMPVYVSGDADALCFDAFTGRPFESSIQAIESARNEINALLNHDGYASVNDFHERIGLPHTDVGEAAGWTSDELLTLEITAIVYKDKPCLFIQYRTKPRERYWKHG